LPPLKLVLDESNTGLIDKPVISPPRVRLAKIDAFASSLILSAPLWFEAVNHAAAVIHRHLRDALVVFFVHSKVFERVMESIDKFVGTFHRVLESLATVNNHFRI